MEIEQPKLLINLFGSFGLEFDNSYRTIAFDRRSKLPHVDHSEVSDADYEATCRKICTFLTECVIPLATQTNALVIVHHDGCTLAQCLDKVMASVRSKYGNQMPFTIVNFGWATTHHLASEEPGSVAAGLRGESLAWQSQLGKIKEGLESTLGDSCRWFLEDAPSCATHYVIVDGVSTTTVGKRSRKRTTKCEWSALRKFKSEFVGALAASLPNIAVAMLDAGRWDCYQVFADYAARSLPLLLVDTRSRAGEEGTAAALVNNKLTGEYSRRASARGLHDAAGDEVAGSCCKRRRAGGGRAPPVQPVTGSAIQSAIAGIKDGVLANGRSTTAALKKVGRVDRYLTSNLAYAHSVRAELASRLQGGKRQGSLDEAIRVSQQHGESGNRTTVAAAEEQQPDVAACMSQFSDGLVDVVLQLAEEEQDLLIAREKARLTNDMRQLRERAASGLEQFKKEIPRLTSAWVFQWQKPRVYISETGKTIAGGYLCDNHGDWFELDTIKDVDSMNQETSVVTCLKVKDSVEEKDVGGILDKLDEVADYWKSESEGRTDDEDPLWYCGYPGRTSYQNSRENPPLDVSIALKLLLTNPSVFSGSLDNLQSLQATLERAAKIDRLPASNSREALLILRQAWDHVDIFSDVAKSNKKVAKVAFVAILATSLWVTCSTIVASNVGTLTELDVASISHFMLALTISSSLIAGYMSFVDPLTKWHELKAASLDLESEIWKFRCRVGGYSSGERLGTEVSGAEAHLASSLRSTKQHVFKSASLQETGFYAKLNVFNTSRSSVYKHGQYGRPCSRGGTLGNSPAADNHQSPLKPQEYLEYRVKPLIRFYQNRLPAYYRSRALSTAVLMLSTIVSSLLILLKQAPWTAVLAALSTVVTAWSAFHSTDKKLARYSATINAIDELVLWWNEMTDVEKASIPNINAIVGTCEEIFKQERQAWLSTSLSQKLLVDSAKGNTSGAGDSKGGSDTGGSSGFGLQQQRSPRKSTSSTKAVI
jgi:hypothetical protein